MFVDLKNQKNDEFEETFEKYKQNYLNTLYQQIDDVVKDKIEYITNAQEQLLQNIPREILDSPAEEVMKKKFNLLKILEQLERVKVKNIHCTPQKLKFQQYFETSPRNPRNYTPQKKIVTSKKKMERLMFLSKDKNWRQIIFLLQLSKQYYLFFKIQVS